MALLRLRSLLSRGRARAGPETTLVAARLFGSLTGFDDVPLVQDGTVMLGAPLSATLITGGDLS